MTWPPSALTVLVWTAVIAALGPARAQTGPPVCGFVLNTTSHFTPVGAMPTVWAPVEEPVFVRLYTTERFLAWTVRRVSDRELGASGITSADSASIVRARQGAAQVLSDTLDGGYGEVRKRCPGEVYYQDIVLDDADANRSRVYGLDVALASSAASLRGFSGEKPEPASYYFNVRRYRPVYAEASLGPVVSMARLVTHTVERLGSGTTPQVVLNETEQRGQVELAAGALLRPWGYNPNTSLTARGGLTKFALYAATPVSKDFLDAFYLGLGYGTQGITAAAGLHVYNRTAPLDGVALGVPLDAPVYRDDVAELTRRSVAVAPFFSLQLNSSLFGTLFGKPSGTATP